MRFLLAISFLASVSSAHPLGQYFENVVNVSSRLWVAYPDGSRGTVAGTSATGYILNKAQGLIVTNLHNITPCMQAAGEKESWHPSAMQKGTNCQAELDLNFPFKDSVRQIRGAKIVDYGMPPGKDLAHDDWAILQVNPQLLKDFSEVKASPRELTAGEKIFFVGFPAKPVGQQIQGDAYFSEGQILSKTEAKETWSYLYKGFRLSFEQFAYLEKISDLNYFKHANVFFHNAPIYYGFSGSGVIDEKGNLIGLIFGAANLWNMKFGDRPAELNIDPWNVTNPVNKLSMGISMRAVCSSGNYCK